MAKKVALKKSTSKPALPKRATAKQAAKATTKVVKKAPKKTTEIKPFALALSNCRPHVALIGVKPSPSKLRATTNEPKASGGDPPRAALLVTDCTRPAGKKLPASQPSKIRHQ